MAPSHSTQLKFMCGHIIHEHESKLVSWGVTQAKASSQNRKEGLHKALLKDLYKDLNKELHKDLNKELHKDLHVFEVLG